MYETPEVLATFEVDEIVAEAAVCTGQYEYPELNL
jgi:hypothetical protein